MKSKQGRKDYHNTRRENFLASLPAENCMDDGCTLVKKCKFNFSYLTSPGGGCAFSDCNLGELMGKLQEFSREPISIWETRNAGSNGGKVFVYYDAYPAHSTFPRPKSVPADAHWGRFRINYTYRLVGFSIPEELDGKLHEKLQFRFDRNTFYCVFIDEDHEFCP